MNKNNKLNKLIKPSNKKKGIFGAIEEKFNFTSKNTFGHLFKYRNYSEVFF